MEETNRIEDFFLESYEHFFVLDEEATMFYGVVPKDGVYLGLTSDEKYIVDSMYPDISRCVITWQDFNGEDIKTVKFTCSVK